MGEDSRWSCHRVLSSGGLVGECTVGDVALDCLHLTAIYIRGLLEEGSGDSV